MDDAVLALKDVLDMTSGRYGIEADTLRCEVDTKLWKAEGAITSDAAGRPEGTDPERLACVESGGQRLVWTDNSRGVSSRGVHGVEDPDTVEEQMVETDHVMERAL